MKSKGKLHFPSFLIFLEISQRLGQHESPNSLREVKIRIPDKKIQDILRVSFDSLQEDEQKIN